MTNENGSSMKVVPEIPDLRGGRKEDRRKGGAVIARVGAQAAGRGLLSGLLSGGMGNGLLAAMVAATSIYSLHSLNAGDIARSAQAHAPRMFASRPAYDPEAVKELPSDSSAGNSLADFAMANRGALSAGAGAGAGDGANASPAGGQNAGPGAAAADATGANPSDAAAQAAAQAQAQAQALAGSRFGQLSSHTGGGSSLAGGVGLSGGIGRGFTNLAMGDKGPAGQVSAMTHPAAAKIAKSAPARAVPVTGKGTLNRLRSMSGAMKSTANMANLQQASAIQTAQWSSAQVPTGDGMAISGGGDFKGAGQAVTGAGDEGGPMNQPAGGSGSTQSAPNPGPGKDDTPWTGLVNTAQKLILAASVLIMAAGILMESGIGAYIGAALYWAGVALAAAAAAIGVMIMAKYGQTAQGMIITVSAAILAGMALWNVESPTTLIETGIGGIVSSILGNLGNKVKSN